MTDYPVAKDAPTAIALLRQGEGLRAPRQKEAETLAGGRVAFVSQDCGPLYENEIDALNAWAGLVEDNRPGHIFVPQPQDRACKLVCRMTSAPKRRKSAAQPVFHAGERWPRATSPLTTAWQVSVSYWKILDATAEDEPSVRIKGDVRGLRKKARTGALSRGELLSLMDSPLTAPRPQKALDFGLFDFVPPDDPGIVIADE